MYSIFNYSIHALYRHVYTCSFPVTVHIFFLENKLLRYQLCACIDAPPRVTKILLMSRTVLILPSQGLSASLSLTPQPHLCCETRQKSQPILPGINVPSKAYIITDLLINSPFNPKPGGYINWRCRAARSHIWLLRRPIREREALRHAAAGVGTSDIYI